MACSIVRRRIAHLPRPEKAGRGGAGFARPDLPVWRLLIGPGYALLTLPRRRARHPTGTTRAKESAIPAKVFVGNLSFNTTKERLQEFLAPAGNIVEVFLPTDRATGRLRGFAFVEYQTESEAQACIEQFNEKELDGRNLRINSAEDRPRRPGGFSPGGGGGGYGGGGAGGGGGDPFFGGGRPFKSKGSRRNLRARKRGG